MTRWFTGLGGAGLGGGLALSAAAALWLSAAPAPAQAEISGCSDAGLRSLGFAFDHWGERTGRTLRRESRQGATALEPGALGDIGEAGLESIEIGHPDVRAVVGAAAAVTSDTEAVAAVLSAAVRYKPNSVEAIFRVSYDMTDLSVWRAIVCQGRAGGLYVLELEQLVAPREATWPVERHGGY